LPLVEAGLGESPAQRCRGGHRRAKGERRWREGDEDVVVAIRWRDLDKTRGITESPHEHEQVLIARDGEERPSGRVRAAPDHPAGGVLDGLDDSYLGILDRCATQGIDDVKLEMPLRLTLSATGEKGEDEEIQRHGGFEDDQRPHCLPAPPSRRLHFGFRNQSVSSVGTNGVDQGSGGPNAVTNRPPRHKRLSHRLSLGD